MSKRTANKTSYQKGHPGYYKGKRINKRIFVVAYNAYSRREINRADFAQMCGVSAPTLQKRLYDLWTNGYLPHYLFEDDRPLTLDGYDRGFDKYGETEEKKGGEGEE